METSSCFNSCFRTHAETSFATVPRKGEAALLLIERIARVSLGCILSIASCFFLLLVPSVRKLFTARPCLTRASSKEFSPQASQKKMAETFALALKKEFGEKAAPVALSIAKIAAEAAKILTPTSKSRVTPPAGTTSDGKSQNSEPIDLHNQEIEIVGPETSEEALDPLSREGRAKRMADYFLSEKCKFPIRKELLGNAEKVSKLALEIIDSFENSEEKKLSRDLPIFANLFGKETVEGRVLPLQKGSIQIIYTLYPTLGEGSFNEVSDAYVVGSLDREMDSLVKIGNVALRKLIPPSREECNNEEEWNSEYEESIRQWLTEVKLHDETLNSIPQVIKSYGYSTGKEEERFVVQILQRCGRDYGDYLGELNDNYSSIPKDKWLEYAKELASGLNSFGTRYHGDFSPENVIFDGDKLKIIDFSTTKLKIGERKKVEGRLHYMPPPAFSWPVPENSQIDEKIDSFSLGLTFLEMLALEDAKVEAGQRLRLWKSLNEYQRLTDKAYFPFQWISHWVREKNERGIEFAEYSDFYDDVLQRLIKLPLDKLKDQINGFKEEVKYLIDKYGLEFSDNWELKTVTEIYKELEGKMRDLAIEEEQWGNLAADIKKIESEAKTVLGKKIEDFQIAVEKLLKGFLSKDWVEKSVAELWREIEGVKRTNKPLAKSIESLRPLYKAALDDEEAFSREIEKYETDIGNFNGDVFEKGAFDPKGKVNTVLFYNQFINLIILQPAIIQLNDLIGKLRKSDDQRYHITAGLLEPDVNKRLSVGEALQMLKAIEI